VCSVTRERAGSLYGIAGFGLVAALGLALVPAIPRFVAVLVALGGLLAGAVEVVPPAWKLLLQRRSLLVVVVIAILGIAWLAAGLTTASHAWPGYLPLFPNAFPNPVSNFSHAYDFVQSTSWPWRVDRVPLLPLAIAFLSATGGLVLVSDAVRVQLGFAGPPRSPWRSLTQTPTRGGRTAARAIPGLVLIGVATFVAISLVSRFSEYHSQQAIAALLILGVGLSAALLIAAPVGIGLFMRLDLDKAGSAREEERLRFAAHLHDSVLQTLALIQRQAHDPAAVAKLARRQEHALRAWMAGETDLTSATLAGAVRDVVAEVEDDHEITVELTAIGDTKLDARGEELVAATREALRNAARHAPGVPVYVFLDIGTVGAELFVRDNGPGFDPDAVPAERRGLRDAVVGRMSFAGGSATVESTPGEGTEVALKLPINGKSR
jgi:signal transduction histidine kinase